MNWNTESEENPENQETKEDLSEAYVYVDEIEDILFWSWDEFKQKYADTPRSELPYRIVVNGVLYIKDM